MGSANRIRKSNGRRPLSIDFGEQFGPEWAEISADAGGLRLPGWRAAFSPGDLRAAFFRLQEVELLRLEAQRLRRERAEAWQRAAAAEDRAEWYRRQLGAASRHAAILLALDQA